MPGDLPVTTFSIVAHDPDTGDLGIAVASRFLGAGAVVPWARAGVGAVATQAWANTSYGPRGLDLLAEGLAPEDVIARLTEADEYRDERQVGIVDAQGRAASYTGKDCLTWAGHRVGPGFACQGNILAGEDVVAALATTFAQTAGSLWDRLLAAMAAGQRAGGDRRGQQSAALLVVRAGGGYGGFNDRFMDLRVDDHPRPIDELARILELHKLYFLPSDPADILPLDANLVRELQGLLQRTRDYAGPTSGTYDDATDQALRTYCARANLEARLQAPGQIDRRVLDCLRQEAR
jgi:uncharacterized Ntn-hydrolase superfamily protein